ncbi:MAG: hypothetical protein ACE5FU_12340 [Nitrospinota bacterium]
MNYFLAILFMLLPMYSFAETGQSTTSPEEIPKKTSGKNALKRRIDFGDSYITGQTIKSGAVYLLQRKPSEIKSMLTFRESYRDEILEDFSVKEKGSLSGGAGASLIDGLGER